MAIDTLQTGPRIPSPTHFRWVICGFCFLHQSLSLAFGSTIGGSAVASDPLGIPAMGLGRAEETQAESVTVISGAYYFDGWTGKTDRWHLPRRLKEEFGERCPIWGWVTSTPDIMRQQIDCAANHGLNFFAFCWYYPEDTNKVTPLNNALNIFLEAPNQKKLDFCILVANHEGFRIGPAEWEACCTRWLALFKNPSYVKADGKPLIIFLSPYTLDKLFGGPEAVRAAFDQLRTKAEQAGLPGVSIAGCWDARELDPPKSGLPKNEVESGYSFVTGYAMPHFYAPNWPKKRQTFQHLIDGHVKAWDILARHSTLPYIPVATLGWDMRPWEKPGLLEDQQVIYFPDRTPQKLETMVRNAKWWIGKNPLRTSREKLLLMYAWNEYGEGGYITPTKQDGSTYLEAVKRGLNSPMTAKDGSPNQ
jgi:hypothetical protein